jgi:hypothetical protein
LMIETPYDLTQDGEIDIAFNEHSMSGGFWGVYDIIISNQDSLPEKLVPSGSNIKEKPEKRKKYRDDISSGNRPEVENKVKDKKKLKDRDASAKKSVSKKQEDIKTEEKIPADFQGKDTEAPREALKITSPRDTTDVKKPDDPGLPDKKLKQPEVKNMSPEPTVIDVKGKDN